MKMISVFKFKITEFFLNLKQEKIETKELVKILFSSFVNKKKLTKDEKDFILNQSKDVLKSIGVITIFILPGGSLILILGNYLKINNFILPSSFQEKKLEKNDILK